MKLILLILLILGTIFGIKAINKRKDQSVIDHENAKNEAWKDTKTTSQRVGYNNGSEVKKASDKIDGITTDSYNKSGVYSSKIAKKSYGPKVDPIIEEGNKALAEMGRIYMSSKDESVKEKITEIMKITDKIMQEAINDPDDIPQIKKFFKYYLPTTIKLLNSYDRMDSLEIDGKNIDNSKANINEMLDVAIEAYKKRLDSLFENQALDIETEIDVMNHMLEREGLLDKKDFILKEGTSNG